MSAFGDKEIEAGDVLVLPTEDGERPLLVLWGRKTPEEAIYPIPTSYGFGVHTA